MNFKTIDNVDIKKKTVLIRVDFNVPIKNGEVQSDKRIVEALPTIKKAIKSKAKVVIFSHLGRVETEEDKKKSSLEPVSKVLAKFLKKDVKFISETRGKKLELAIKEANFGDVIMVENTRFEDIDGKKESKNSPELGKYWASLGDVFVNDAFGTAHRAAASNVGIASNISVSCVGYLIEKELRMLSIVDNPKRPLIAILGGAKVSDKIQVIENLLTKADKILIGGAMAYTFLKAQGYEVGKSKVEEDYLKLAKDLLKKSGSKILLPIDHAYASTFADETRQETKDIEIPKNSMALDIGSKTIELYSNELSNAKTVVWNGPMGVAEFSNFATGTLAIAKKLSKLRKATTIIGGGDSAAAVIELGFEKKFSHISTGGGASLEYLEGKKLPGIECIQNN